jgi:hypothetical protein
VPAPKERDLEQTRKDLEAWLATRLPEATDVRVGELSGPGTTGFSSDTLIFDARWRSGGADANESLVARLRPSGMTVFPEYDIARQYRIQEILEQSGIPTAPMRWLEEDERFLGAPFYVMGRVDGRIPTDTPPYHTGGWVTEIEPAEPEPTVSWSGPAPHLWTPTWTSGSACMPGWRAGPSPRWSMRCAGCASIDPPSRSPRCWPGATRESAT